MRRLRESEDVLVLRQSAFVMYVIGGAFALVGGFFLLVSATATLTCDRAADSCTLERKGLWKSEARTFRLADIDRAAVYEFTSSDGANTYSLALETGGEVVYFLSASTSTRAKQLHTADEINFFLADPQTASLVATRDDRGVTFLFAGIFGGAGLFLLFLVSGPTTVTFDRFRRTVTRTAGGRLRRSSKTLKFDDVAGLGIIESQHKSGGVYALFLRLSSGDWLQLNSVYTPKLPAMREIAEDVREFLDLPPVEEQLRPALGKQMKQVGEQMKEVMAQREERLREAATALVQEGEAVLLTSDSAITRLAADLPTRAVAVFIDFLVLSAAAYSLANAGFELKATVGAWTVFAFGYYTLYEGMNGATLGKSILRMRVVQLDGSPITWKQSAIRNGVRFIDAFGFYLVGWLVARKSPARQRLGDRLAGTVVVWRLALPVIEEAARKAARGRA